MISWNFPERNQKSESALNFKAIVNTFKNKTNEQANISQLCGQFSINTNFAKTFQGLETRIGSKIIPLQ